MSFEFDTNTPYSDFDGIILTFEKGNECWGEDTGTISFRTLGDFDRFSVTPAKRSASISTSGEFLHDLKELLTKRNPVNVQDSYLHLFGASTVPGSEQFWTKKHYTHL
jgi:hypothetical protein